MELERESDCPDCGHGAHPGASCDEIEAEEDAATAAYLLENPPAQARRTHAERMAIVRQKLGITAGTILDKDCGESSIWLGNWWTTRLRDQVTVCVDPTGAIVAAVSAAHRASWSAVGVEMAERAEEIPPRMGEERAGYRWDGESWKPAQVVA